MTLPPFIGKHKKLLIIIIVIFLGVFVIRKITAGGGKKVPSTGTVTIKRLEETMTISGKIDAHDKAVLQFQTLGKLVWVGVKEGDTVKKYQVIASLDQTQLQKQLQKYLEAYSTTRSTFDQTQDDNEGKIITDSLKRILDKSQSSLNSSVLDVEIQNEALRLATLTTPIGGIVTRVDTPQAGVNITLPSQAQFEVVDPNTIYFSALADQTEVTKLTEGMKGSLILDAFDNATFSGTIEHLSFVPKTGETGTVYEVQFTFPTASNSAQIRIGMTGDVTFVTSEKPQALTVPLKFIKVDTGTKYVNIMKNGKIKKTTVTTGLETDTDIEITGGEVSEGDTVYD